MDEALPLSIIEFSANNPHVRVSREEGRLVINRPWGYEDAQFALPVEATAVIEELRHILIVPQLDAFLHLDINEAEFIFAFLLPKDDKVAGYLDRDFLFHFDGAQYSCAFREPS